MIANDSQHLIQLAETGVRNDSNVACERSVDRERREKEEAAMHAAAHPPIDERTAGYHRELAAKDEAKRLEQLKAEARDLTNGTLVIATDGTKLRRYPSGRLELY